MLAVGSRKFGTMLTQILSSCLSATRLISSIFEQWHPKTLRASRRRKAFPSLKVRDRIIEILILNLFSFLEFFLINENHMIIEKKKKEGRK
ncbi:hypothetical protein AXF42_Ash014628 [Apostasia shenzhenica]|uniref:Uncharacterized protein n=1 Tax=Apostasia shenzhenica TaxID=1088818 RepID=A0A2I0AKH7_9ASPA|nr:hypothetical protein AXF42_Ash014628 [Apostasia shenzhenica]